MNRKQWWKVLLLIFVVSAAGVAFIGIKTYQDAPPIPDFVAPDGRVLASSEAILRGQAVFQKYALMEYGTMFGDGAGRGPDFTAEALHRVAAGMIDFYSSAAARAGESSDAAAISAIATARVREELKANRYIPDRNSVALTEAQAIAYAQLLQHYQNAFGGVGAESMKPARYINDAGEIQDLTAFFFWGGWVCAVERPGFHYSYTQDWPFDPAAGNTPTAPVMLWSLVGALALIAVLGVVLYAYGRSGPLEPAAPAHPANNGNGRPAPPGIATIERVAAFRPTPTQRAAYKFFALAAVLFLIQVLAGVLTVHDFVGLTVFFGVDIARWFPITVVRSWHLQLSLFWISTCWIGATIFLLPMICRPEPKRQLAWVNTLFWALVVLIVGSSAGIILGPKGALGNWWRELGNQGWEFVELGRAWQWVLYAGLAMWGVIVFRGVRPALTQVDPWAMPNWLVCTIASIVLLLTSGFVAGPRTNFVVGDFWRWCVIHMWVEAFFEVFTTILVGYFMYVMGLVTARAAVRVVYLASVLFLGSGLLGISHNFYWNAKSVETVALGSVFSTLQVVPLILLTLEAWRFRRMPADAVRHLPSTQGRRPEFGLGEAFLFMIGVNFWNFVGAGVFGFIINLPIVNYYEHGTYLTVNHGHAALMGVYGNLAIAAMLFCGRFLVRDSAWNAGLLRCAFWALNVGLALMVILDLFPAGIMQLRDTLENGLWHARSQAFVLGNGFQTVTWLRVIGGALFLVGGVAPLAWFLVSRVGQLRESLAADAIGPAVVTPGVLAVMDGAGNGRPHADVGVGEPVG